MHIKINQRLSFLLVIIFFPIITLGQVINGEILDKKLVNDILKIIKLNKTL